jgi:hypothetical protein
MKMTKSQLDQIINEEVARFFKIKNLKKQLNEVTEQLEEMESEDDLDEVKAGSPTHVKSHAWTGEEDGDVKWKPEFEKKGSHLLEDEGLEGVGMDMSGEFEKMFAEIGKMIDAKLGSGEDEVEGDEFEDVEMDMEDPEDEGDDDDEGEDVEISDAELEEIHAKMEEGEYMEGEGMEEEDMTKEYAETMGNETETVDSDAMTMKKEGEYMNESVTTRKYKILSEGMASESKLSSEIERMRKLAKLD